MEFQWFIFVSDLSIEFYRKRIGMFYYCDLFPPVYQCFISKLHGNKLFARGKDSILNQSREGNFKAQHKLSDAQTFSSSSLKNFTEPSHPKTGSIQP